MIEAIAKNEFRLGVILDWIVAHLKPLFRADRAQFLIVRYIVANGSGPVQDSATMCYAAGMTIQPASLPTLLMSRASAKDSGEA
jgi:hypothetical protein